MAIRGTGVSPVVSRAGSPCHIAIGRLAHPSTGGLARRGGQGLRWRFEDVSV